MLEQTEIREVRPERIQVGFAPTFLQLVERANRQMAFLAQCMLFVTVVSLAVFAISELAARDTMSTLLISRATTLKSDFVERTRVMAPSTSASSPASEMERDLALAQIERVEDLKRSIQSLAALGAEDWSRSLRATQRKFADLSRSELPQSAESTAVSPDFSRLTVMKVSQLLLYSSDQLLAIILLSCGSIGAMISSLRSNQSLSLRSFILGLASGFVAYLIIKGGRHVFLLQSQGEIIAFNPYGSAFAGLLAGLFTEKAHQLLSFLVDDIAHRIRAASTVSAHGKDSTQSSDMKRLDA